MKTNIFTATSIMLACLVSMASERAAGQAREFGNEVSFAERNLGGPRLGITYVVGQGKLADKLAERGMGNFISQFGWHFEYQIIPEGGGPQFVIQAVPLVAGVEYGTLIPSGTIVMGVRFPGGFEFGLGPNVMLGGEKGVMTALVMGVGQSFNYGGVSIPLNLVWATNPDGNRVSVIFGYAIMKSR